MNGVFAVTIPAVVARTIELDRGDYMELYVRDRKTIVLKKHGTKPKGVGLTDI
jgi:bifunctional DNA-binding transcriptional regulator/antitoxin component of YhaV-PrlF toxin-antitoxin module